MPGDGGNGDSRFGDFNGSADGVVAAKGYLARTTEICAHTRAVNAMALHPTESLVRPAAIIIIIIIHYYPTESLVRPAAITPILRRSLMRRCGRAGPG